jgi:hypothetical protein
MDRGKYSNFKRSVLARAAKCGVDPETIDTEAHYDSSLSSHELKAKARELVPCGPRETGEYPEPVIGVPEKEYHRLEANVERCGSQLKSCQEKVRKLSAVKPAVAVSKRVIVRAPSVRSISVPITPPRPVVKRPRGAVCTSISCVEAKRMLKLFKKLGIEGR